ncbi:MAG: hypothetical protein KDC45_15555 [Bacteroidetes bacterium]|nr:hypothetical protein [Bacteroidota bacterium]
MKRLLICLFVATLVLSCGKGKDTPKKEMTAIKITPVERTEEMEKPQIKIVSPKADEVLKTSKLAVQLTVEGYDLGKVTDNPRAKEIANSGKGQHVHVIVDNKPYEACYEVGKPFELPGELEPGAHTLRVFPSRSYHESLKGGGWDAVNFYVEKKEGTPADLTQPTLTYSRPKGTYKGDDTKSIMVDFWLSNCTLSEDGFKVRLTIDGANETLLTDWKPYFVSGLTMGKHTFELELIDKDGQAVAGPFNKTAREVSLEP